MSDRFSKQLFNYFCTLGIQVVAGMNNDRLCLAVACHLERVFGGWRSFE